MNGCIGVGSVVQSKPLSSTGNGVGKDARGSAVINGGQEGGGWPVGALLGEGARSLLRSKKYSWRLNLTHSDRSRLLITESLDKVW